MKNLFKLFFSLAAFTCVMAACDVASVDQPRWDDKVTYASDGAGKFIPLSYDNSTTILKNTANRTVLYDINGQYVKLSVFDNSEDPEEPDFQLTGGLLVDDDVKDVKLIEEVEIVKITADGQKVTSVAELGGQLASSLADESLEFDFSAALEEGAGYILKAQVAEEEFLYFAVVVTKTTITTKPGQVQVYETPFGGPVYEDVDFKTLESDLFYCQFDANGNWI